jgi:hypothetical protein
VEGDCLAPLAEGRDISLPIESHKSENYFSLDKQISGMNADNIIALLKIVGGLLSGFFLEYNGISMIQHGITSQGATTLKLFGLEVTSVDLGIIVIALGVLLQIMTIKHKIVSEKKADGETWISLGSP